MAQDFHEETYFKRYMLTKLAYEAQSVALKRMRKRAKNDKESQVKVISGPKGAEDEALNRSFVENQANKPIDGDFLAGPGPRQSLTIQTGHNGFPEVDNHGNSPDAFLDRRPNNSRCPLLDPNTPTRPNIDIDMLWTMDENQNEAIKSDLDNFSKKSLPDAKNDDDEDQKR